MSAEYAPTRRGCAATGPPTRARSPVRSSAAFPVTGSKFDEFYVQAHCPPDGRRRCVWVGHELRREDHQGVNGRERSCDPFVASPPRRGRAGSSVWRRALFSAVSLLPSCTPKTLPPPQGQSIGVGSRLPAARSPGECLCARSSLSSIFVSWTSPSSRVLRSFFEPTDQCNQLLKVVPVPICDPHQAEVLPVVSKACPEDVES